MKPRRRKKGDTSSPWVFRYFEDGTKKSKYKQVILPAELDQKEAEAIYRQRLAEAAERGGKAYAPHTFGDLAEKYLAGRELAPNWAKTVDGLLRLHLLPVFGKTLFSKLKAYDVDLYRKARMAEAKKGAKVSVASVNREVTTLLVILNYAEKKNLIERSPIRRGAVETPAEELRELYFTPDEWYALLGAFDQPAAWEKHRAKIRRLGPIIADPEAGTERRHGGGIRPDSKASHAYRDRLRQALDVLHAALLTGSRIGEVIGLTWDAVDLEEGIVTVYQPKVKASKLVPVTPELRALLKAQTQGIGKAPVFQKPGGGAWEKKLLNNAFQVAKKLSGVRRELRIHDLRHTAASWAEQAGVQEGAIKAFLGHAVQGATGRYVHRSAESSRPAAEAVSRIVGNAPRVTRLGDAARNRKARKRR